LVEAAGQLFHLFREGLDYAFILRIDCSMSGMRGVLLGFRSPHPSPLLLGEGMKKVIIPILVPAPSLPYGIESASL